MNKRFLLPIVSLFVLILVACNDHAGFTPSAVVSTSKIPLRWIDSDGNIFIADTVNQAVRKVDATTGIISTVAGIIGSEGSSSSGDGLAIHAQLQYPYDVAFDSTANMYFNDTSNSVIRKVDATTGIISTVAGIIGSAGSSSSDDGLAIHAQLSYPYGLALDLSNNIYIADIDNSAVRKVDATTGIISTVAGIIGSAGSSSSGDGLAIHAELNEPAAVAVDANGNIFIADAGNHAIYKVDSITGIITTVAGVVGVSGSSSSGDGLAIHAELNQPFGVAVDTSANIYVVDSANFAIRKVDAATGIISTVAGILGSQGSSSSDDGLAIHAELNGPGALAFDSAGNLYIGDTGNAVVRKVDLTTGVISTAAGIIGTQGSSSSSDHLAIHAELDKPFDTFD